MRRNVIRVAACALASAMVITGYPAVSISAATAGSVLPSGGGILATGSGVSIKDLKAERARSIAQQKAKEVHNNINKEAEKRDDNTLTASTSDKIDISIKAETPASKAVRDAEIVNGMSVVGSAASGAAMTVTETEEAMELIATPEPTPVPTISDNSVSDNSVSDNSVSGNSVSDNSVSILKSIFF